MPLALTVAIHPLAITTEAVFWQPCRLLPIWPLPSRRRGARGVGVGLRVNKAIICICFCQKQSNPANMANAMATLFSLRMMPFTIVKIHVHLMLSSQPKCTEQF